MVLFTKIMTLLEMYLKCMFHKVTKFYSYTLYFLTPKSNPYEPASNSRWGFGSSATCLIHIGSILPVHTFTFSATVCGVTKCCLEKICTNFIKVRKTARISN